jgi:serine protease Do
MVARDSISKPVFFAFFFLVSSVLSAQSALEQVEKEVQQLFDACKSSVVQIKAIQTSAIPPLAIGTGFFIDKDGLILTSSQVVSDANPNDIQVIWEGKKFEAKRIGFDPRTNLALLKIESKNTPALKFGDSGKVRVGAMVIGIGYPLNSNITPEVGNVSSIGLGQTIKFFATSHICSTVRVMEGQAGSPLLNTKAEVVGMIVAVDSNGSHSYAIPTAAIKIVQPDLIKFQQPQYGFVGIGINEITADAQGNLLPQPKIVVEQVYPGTSADTSGIKKDDQILEINGQPIREAADVMNATFYLRVSDKMTIKVRKSTGEEKSYQIQIGPRPVQQQKPPAQKLGQGIQISAPGGLPSANKQ